jgi:diguanylate cyclase (GGDEF)-like protein/PAS domain S-box-containing protein
MATILIVDDLPLNRRFLSVVLGFGGYRLLEAADGMAALEMVRAEKPDLIITDILMPNMDGFEFVVHLHEDASIADIPVVFYTATYREREAKTMAQTCGVKWVLPKPCEPEVILQTVQEALGLQPQAMTSTPPKLPATIGNGQSERRFATINDQLAECLVELETSSRQMSDIADNSRGDGVESDDVFQIRQRLSESLSNLQAVGLRLTALIELGIELTAERDPVRLLQIGCRVAQNICVAKYAAIGMLDDDGGQLKYFFTCGLNNRMLPRLGATLPGIGILGTLLEGRAPRRINGLDGDPQVLGLPASHPPIHSFLGVPIVLHDRAYGWLYLADKLGADGFGAIDEQAAVTVASQLAVAYENRVLYDRIRQHHAMLQNEIDERRQVQEAQRKTLIAKTVMAECNRVLVHADDEASLLVEMCRSIVIAGGYQMAWIGYTGNDGSVTPMAQEGVRLGYLNQFPVFWIENEYGWCPTGTAIRECRAHFVPDIASDERLGRWRERALDYGYRSAVSFPMRDDMRVFGALTIYENTKDAFEPDQIAMFEQLADDIAYGVMNLRNRAAREHAERALVAAEQKLAGILDSIDNVVWSVSDAGMLFLNPMAETLYGRPVDEFYRNKNLWFEVIHPEDQPRVREMRARLLDQGATTQEYRIVRPDGDVRWVEERAKTVRDRDGHLLRIDGVASDISEHKAYEDHIGFLANHDALTNLANRNLLSDRIGQAILHARRAGRMLALLFLDLDRFKDVNDCFGHSVGDALLKAVADRIRKLVREGDTVARQGGDEFIILFTNFQYQQDIVNVAAKLIHALSEPFLIEGHELHMSASIGATVFPGDGDDAPTLLRNADTAMYRAKEERGNAFQFYSQEMSEQAIERSRLESALRQAIERKEFEVFYQPQVDIATGQIRGVEALIRWHRPGFGMIPPVRFVPLAEETGLIVPIGEWVLRTACAQNKAWQDAGLPACCVSVNLSARQFKQPDLADMVAAVLRETGLEPQYLDLELTESLVMSGAEQFISKLQALNAMGVQLSIDDFGTGYSSLSYLKRFPINTLKIDQSFVRDIVTDVDDAAITRSVISLGHSLNLKVIAEGVETDAQLAYLRRHGCDKMQGYLFSRPVPAMEFAQMLREGKSMAVDTDVAEATRKTLLIVDDEPITLMSLKGILRQDGYRILTALTPIEAFEALALHPVHVVVCDQRMPLMFGTELLGKVRDLYPDTIRIVLSSHTDFETIIDAVNSGAVYRFYTKPWKIDVLRDNIREAFRLHALIFGVQPTLKDSPD